MIYLTEKEYNAIPSDFRGVWNTERTDIPNWDEMRASHMDKRTMMKDSALLVEGIGFEIINPNMSLSAINKEHQAKTDKLLNDCLVFWAFDDKQFLESKTPLQEGEKYVAISGGGYLPKGKLDQLLKGFDDIELWHKKALAESGNRQKHIAYELANHEAYYTGSIDSTLDALGDDYDANEVLDVYRKEYKAWAKCNGY